MRIMTVTSFTVNLLLVGSFHRQLSRIHCAWAKCQAHRLELLIANRLFDCGIIAGNRRLDPIIAPLLLPGRTDGKVTVAATKIAGMRDHIVLPVQHTGMVRDAAVIAQIRAYLATGAFSR